MKFNRKIRRAVAEETKKKGMNETVLSRESSDNHEVLSALCPFFKFFAVAKIFTMKI
jgi:hypothetical protein